MKIKALLFLYVLCLFLCILLDLEEDLRRLIEKSDQFSYQCKLCNYTANQSQQVRNHIEAKHNVGQVYDCDLCQKSFSTKNSLSVHKSRSHNKKWQ